MEIILLQDVNNLGYKDDIVTVKNGYANNYLLPLGKAINATHSNIVFFMYHSTKWSC